MNKKQILQGQPVSITSASQSTEELYLDIPNTVSDNIGKILPPNRSNNVDKLHLLKNAFLGEGAMAFDFKKCCTVKGQRFRYLNKNHFRTYSWLVYSGSRKGLFCKYCSIFSTS